MSDLRPTPILNMNMSASVRTGRACSLTQIVLWDTRARYVPRRSYSYVRYGNIYYIQHYMYLNLYADIRIVFVYWLWMLSHWYILDITGMGWVFPVYVCLVYVCLCTKPYNPVFCKFLSPISIWADSSGVFSPTFFKVIEFFLSCKITRILTSNPEWPYQS